MPLPKPEPGLVVSYAYLWRDEARKGLTEGRKTRPCVIVLLVRHGDGHEEVTVAPITHSPPTDSAAALELPAKVKAHLGLDHDRSWVVLDEVNQFLWPGYDLRPVPGSRGRFAYGFLPPRLFRAIIERMTSLKGRGPSVVNRD